MIGAYIIVRMIELITADRHDVVKGCAAATILITLACVIFILNAGSPFADLR